MIVEKTVSDYIDALCEKYPTIDRSDIKRICNFGWKSLYLLNSYGGDVTIDNSKIWCHFGNLYNDSLLHFKNYVRKLCLKFRVLYKRRHIPWDGYYYFALTDKQYEAYASLQKQKGRKRVHFTFNNIVLYKILDECKVRNYNRKYIFRISRPIGNRSTIFKKEVVLDSPELIITRDILKMKDILISNNNYELL